jgi:hypothetical protein
MFSFVSIHSVVSEPFDNDRDVSMLKKYKSRKPDKIWALLDSSGDV